MSSRIKLKGKAEKGSWRTSCQVAAIALICITIFWFAFSASSYATSGDLRRVKSMSYLPLQSLSKCNYSHGRWVYDPSQTPRYTEDCKEIFKGWNCIANNKPNAKDIYKWRWQPWGCDLPHLDPQMFLSLFRDTNIGFVGDSLNRNMFVALVCSLRKVAKDVKKWRPIRADRGLTFLQYNLTVAYHRTNLLARYGRWSAAYDQGGFEQLGYREGFRVDVDIPDGSWAEAPSYYDVIIFNTGHWWWAPAKFDPVKSPMLFFEKGQPILPMKRPEEGLDIVLKNMINYVEKTTKGNSLKIFRTQSPRHFEGGEWNGGGKCSRLQPLRVQEVDNFFSTEKKATNMEARLANFHLHRALRNSTFHILDITYISEFRADGHPSKWGGKKHEDCMHWCLPGITDHWNDLLMTILLEERMKRSS